MFVKGGNVAKFTTGAINPIVYCVILCYHFHDIYYFRRCVLVIAVIKRIHSKHRLLATILLYCVLTAVLTTVFCGSLLFTGYNNEHIQSVLRKNLKTSVNQFMLEGEYPFILNKGDQSYRLDNYTDTIILQQAYLMDTAKDPAVIFSNPFVSKSYDDPEIPDRILALEEARKNQAGTSHYTYYWIGIRALIRPLLYFFSYQNIRGILSIIFIALWFATSASVYHATGKLTGIAFFLSVLCMNIPVVTSEIQFVPCFYVMFIAVMLITHNQNKLHRAPAILFITGAFTQFLDFYTYPVITLGFPLIVLVFLLKQQATNKPVLMMLKCIFTWFLGYAGFWLIRLFLVEAFTEFDGTFSRAFQRFSLWTGVTPKAQQSKYTAQYTLDLLFGTLMNPHNVLLFITVSVYELGLLIKCAIKKQCTRPTIWPLLISTLPIIWVLLSLKTAGQHYWFQYRMMSIFVFGILSFVGSMIGDSGRSASPTIADRQ